MSICLNWFSIGKLCEHNTNIIYFMLQELVVRFLKIYPNVKKKSGQFQNSNYLLINYLENLTKLFYCFMLL